ncbi:hypothetical protein C6Q15_03625 [Burkholderia multivorans]|uniref:Uncharacterized protein n=1 Tax=Burkholderia multivorans TaxID=87883 RepID=A0A2S9MZY0_9BURK|nr:hypothetical protein C6Q15_03625 [Burkholderia multivorans]
MLGARCSVLGARCSVLGARAEAEARFVDESRRQPRYRRERKKCDEENAKRRAPFVNGRGAFAASITAPRGRRV